MEQKRMQLSVETDLVFCKKLRSKISPKNYVNITRPKVQKEPIKKIKIFHATLPLIDRTLHIIELYHIAGNFRGSKLSQISRFVTNP